MSFRTSKSFLPLAAAVILFSGAGLVFDGAAFAFSQIGAEDGSATQKEGIVSVPLPPLLGEGAAEAATTPSTPTPSTPANGPTGGASVPAPPAGDGTTPSATPSAPADVGTTDEGEVELPVEPEAGAPLAPAPAAAGPAKPLPPFTGPAAPAGAPAVKDADPAAEAAPASNEALPPAVAEKLPPASVFYGEDSLPTPVRDMRSRLIEIARAGEIEALRPYIETGEEATVLTFGGTDEDPIDYLKSASGDGEGVEILAILLEVLQAGHIRSEPATDNEIFVWPYFTGVPIDALTNPQKVELFELVTAGDYQEMLGFGAYNFYRAGISPDGKLQFFVAGD